jgi:glutamate/tyrosine decarboxylase-like PLP-dependent enzyme
VSKFEAAPDFELLASPELSICCFRYVPQGLQPKLRTGNGGDAAIATQLDQLNTNIMNVVQARRSRLPVQCDDPREVCAAGVHHKLSHHSSGY